MKYKNLKAFVVGSSAAVFIVPMVSYYLFAVTLNPETPFTYLKTPTALPVLLGLLNILLINIKKHIPLKNDGLKYIAAGLIYGALMATYGIFVAHIPRDQFMIAEKYIPLIYIFAPITYALVFRYIIKPLNSITGISK